VKSESIVKRKGRRSSPSEEKERRESNMEFTGSAYLFGLGTSSREKEEGHGGTEEREYISSVGAGGKKRWLAFRVVRGREGGGGWGSCCFRLPGKGHSFH